MWWLHRKPEGLESDLRAKIGQNGISSGVGRQDLKFLLCYLSEGRNLLLNTRNNSGDSPSLGTSSPTDRMERFKTVGKLFPSGQLGRTDLNTSSTVIKDLDRHIDITGHVLSPFHQRNLDYQDCRFHYIAHLMCYRYAIVNDQKTFATGIRKWSRYLTEFPTNKFTMLDCVQQWHSILVDIYSHLIQLSSPC